jgi:phenylpropionate dioxygenase-like ring-hydroxylating dioxygenase large terminal subunit
MSTTTMKPGEARNPGPSTRDTIMADGGKAPKELTTESYEYMGSEDIDYSVYTSRDVFNAEMEKLWPKVWQWVCREEHIPEAGDYMVYEVGYHSILVLRTKDMQVKAYYNSCLHRGTQLKPSDSQGSTENLRCPYHGWTWSLEGELLDLPCDWDFPHVNKDEFNLPEVQIGQWGGFIFINMDEDAMPLEEYLEVLPGHFANWPLDQRFTSLHVQKILPANWKASQEAFVEAYHSYETHPQALAFAANNNAQYDIFGERTHRFVHTFGIADLAWPEKQSEQEVLDKMPSIPDGEVLPEGMTARAFAAEFQRKSVGEMFGVDLSSRSVSEMLDSIEYHLFPNMFLFPGVALPMIYRFRPNGDDVDSAIFDLLFLRPLTPGEEPPEAPEPFCIGIEESYETVPGIEQWLGNIYDQDTANLGMQQKGFKAGKKRGATLGNYQEVRIRRLHKTLHQFLNA